MMINIPKYLGKHVSIVLEGMPFKDWPVEKYIEDDLEEKRTYYTFKEHSIEVCCDQDDKISDIFLKSEEANRFDESLFEIPFFSEPEAGSGTFWRPVEEW